MAVKAEQRQRKVLRIGIVQDHQLVQERVVRVGETISVGESTKNTFVFPPTSLPRRFQLFIAKGGRYWLQLTPEMEGKVSYRDAILTAAQLRERGQARKKGSNWVLPLSEENRGKLSVGDVTILFQFVPPPPEPLRAAPMDFRPRLIDENDPVFLGFLGLFTVLAIVLQIYVFTHPPVERVSLDKIPERFTEIIMSPKEEAPPEVEPEAGEQAIQQAKEEQPQEAEKPADHEGEQAKAEHHEQTAEEKAVAEARRQEELQRQVAAAPLLASLIATRGANNSGERVDDPFGAEDAAFQDIDAALRSVTGVDVASSEKLSVRGEQGGSRDDADIGDLGRASAGSADVGSGPAVEVHAKVSVAAGEALGGEGDMASVASVVHKRAGQIQYCYERAMNTNPDLAGRVEVSWTVARKRAVNVTLMANSTGSAELGACIVGKVKGWHFPDEANGIEVVYPFVLSH